GQRVRRRCRPLRPTEPAVAAREARLSDRRQYFAVRLVAHLALREDQRALAKALVDHIENARVSDQRTFRRERFVQFQPMLAMHALDPVDAGIEVARPEARM